MGHIGYKRGRLPHRFSKLTDQQIYDYGSKLTKEDDVLASLGLNPDQVVRAKKVKRWRKFWDIGYGTGLVQKSGDLYDSKDSAIQKLFADKVIPQTAVIDQTIEWTAPKWFYEEIDLEKIKKVRKD